MVTQVLRRIMIAHKRSVRRAATRAAASDGNGIVNRGLLFSAICPTVEESYNEETNDNGRVEYGILFSATSSEDTESYERGDVKEQVEEIIRFATPKNALPQSLACNMRKSF